jgi:hypothetical protein
MNTETRLRHRSFSPLAGTIAMIVLFGLPSAAFADPPAAPVVATRSAKVSLADSTSPRPQAPA